jgi:hypothetical protein
MLKQIKKITVIVALVVLAGAGWPSAIVAAEDGLSLHIAPPKAKLELKPGQQYDGSFEVYNTSNTELNVNVYVKPLSVTEACVESYEMNNEYTMMANWITLSTDKITDFQPGATEVIGYHVDTPLDIPGGGQYAIIFMETTDKQPGMVVVSARVGFKVAADLGGETVREGRLGFIEQDQLYFDPPINSTATIHNSGNIDFQIDSEYTIKNFFGGDAYHNKSSETVLPKSCRIVRQTWSETPAIGLFWVTNKVDFLGQTQHDETKLVLVVPIWFLVIMGGVILLLLTALIMKIRQNRRAARRSE